jgi:ribosomal RNA-processing protein 7
MALKGYKMLSMPLKYGGGFSRFLYYKEHKDKSGVAQGRTLFVTNIPLDATQKDMKKVFQHCGAVESVNLGKSDGLESGGSRFAHVVFKSEESLEMALEMPETVTEDMTSDKVNGLEKYTAEYHKKLVPASKLQQDVDTYLSIFDARAEEAKEERKKLANEPDEDGFTTVVRKKRSAADELEGGPNRKRQQKKKNSQLENFYRFQMRETKRTQLLQLRDKFEDDKQRIQKLKASRKFRPF